MRALFPLLREHGGTWIGWTGVADDHAAPFETDGVQLHPVTLSADDVEAYYEGFSNDTCGRCTTTRSVSPATTSGSGRRT